MNRTSLKVVLLGLCLALCAPAFADDRDTAKLRAAYREADAEYNLGHYREALAKFESLYKVKPLPALLYNIAQCHRQLGELREAAITYKSFIRLDPENSNAQVAKELLPQVEEALAKEEQAKKALPTELDQLQGSPERGTDPASVISPAARASSQPAPSTSPTSGVPRQSALGAAPAAAVSTQALEVQQERAPVHYWLGGGALVAAGAGAFFGLQARSAAKDWRAATADPAWSDARSRAQSSMGLANVAFVAASVLAAASLVTYFAY